MRATRLHIGTLAAAALSVAACSDIEKNPLAPKDPSKLLIADFPRGDGITISLPKPDDFYDITAGEYHTCARQWDGDVYCWGTEGGPAGITKAMMTPTLKFQGARQVSAGSAHTCVRDGANAAYCWGSNAQGQLGLANGQYSPFNSGPVAAPITPPGFTPQGTLAFSTISAGGRSTCGVAASGTYCWGLMGNVQSGGWPGVAAPFPMGTYNGFTTLAVGNSHACGIITSGEAYCWGANQFGQSGVSPAWSYYYANTTMLIFAMPPQLGNTLRRIASQADFTCVDQASGIVQCFGYNYDGELGNGQSGWGNATYVAQTVGGGMQLHGVSTGSMHACALNPSGQAYCWGAGLYGQLGNNQSVNFVSSPVAVTDGRSYRAIAAGRNHTCAIGADNHIYCWGQNNYRQLGTWIVDVNGNVVTNGFAPKPVLTF
jgi:alpha-tubulin suppressor-like RCC1 family protein